jgi:hypothetical protein
MNENKENQMDVMDMQDEVRKAAKTVAHKWPNVVNADDMEQDIYLRLLESPGSVEKLLNDFSDRSRLNAIVRIGHEIAKIEREDYEIFMGDFRYSVDEVKKILDNRALIDLYELDEETNLKSSWGAYFSVSNEFENKVVEKVAIESDVRRAMESLASKNSRYAEVIQRRYGKEEVIPQDESAEHKRLGRALTALTKEMNRDYKRAQQNDGPGSRKPVTAQQARYKSKKNWDDESSEAVQRLMNQARVSGR